MQVYQLVLILFLVAITIPNFSNLSFGAVYMQIPGIDGESEDTEHEGWIDLLSIKYLTESNESEQILVTKNLDKSSPKITHAVSSGLIFKEVKIDLCDSQSCYEKIVLENVYLTGYSFSTSSGSSNGIVEEINLLFESSQLFKERKTTTSSDEPLDEPTKTKGIEEQISQEKIPDWIKNNAGWWAKGLISEDDFVNGIKYLVEQGIIVV